MSIIKTQSHIKHNGLFLYIIVLSCSISIVSAQVPQLTDEQAREKAISAIKDKLNEKFVSVHRLENLEDSYFDYQDYSLSGLSHGVYFFEASRDGTEIKGKQMIFHTITDGGGPIGYVAVARKTGKVYFLHGFKEKMTEFKDLVTDIPVKIDKNNLDYWGRVYFDLVYGQDNKDLINDSGLLKYGVDSNYCAAYWCSQNKSKAEHKSEAWWKTFKKTGLSERLESTTKEDNGFYYVTYKRLRLLGWSWFSPVKTGDPFMTDWTLRISSDGKNIGKSIFDSKSN